MVVIKIGENIKSKTFWRALLAEIFATGILVFVGCGSVLQGTSPHPVTSGADITRISLTFGFIIACLVWIFAPVSGCHMNPAVSIALFCVGHCSLVRAIFYSIAQCVGSTLGIALVYFICPPDKRGNLAVATPCNGTEPINAFVCEVALCFVLLMVVSACIDEGRSDINKIRGTIPLMIGLCITCLAMMGIPYTGASLNPARSLGPAIVSGVWDYHWIYWFGPIFGCCLGALVYRLLFSSRVHPDILIRKKQLAQEALVGEIPLTVKGDN